MSTPSGDSGFLHDLELTVKAELAMAESSGPAPEAIDEWLFDPTDAQREQVGLRSLLGAVEALEHGS